MAGESNGTILDSRAGCVAMLRNLSREELLEILSEGLCQNCDTALQKRIQSFAQRKLNDISISNDKEPESPSKFSPTKSPSSESSTATWASTRTPESIYARPQGNFLNSSPVSTNNKRRSFNPSDYEILLNDGLSKATSGASDVIDEEEKERIRFAQVNAKKDFAYTEKVNGRSLNVLQGLELHTRVFNTEEQKKIVESVYNLQKMGQKGELSARTYSEPRKWMRGKGRITMQFGCCYNYAVDKDGNPPGIVRDEEVDPLPPVFKQMIKRMVRWRVLPSSCVPNSCIVNIYDEGDCIPPHIDHHDFVRPFCTVSFLTECNILFGSNLKILSPGEFSGPVSIPLPVGSVLILNGNGADVAKHCVPGVPSKRISITFRKMDESKSPYWYSPDPELQGIKPLGNSPLTKSLASPIEDRSADKRSKVEESRLFRKTIADALIMNKDEFPPLGRASFGNQQRNKRNGGS